jgi:hypothetical protein
MGDEEEESGVYVRVIGIIHVDVDIYISLM